MAGNILTRRTRPRPKNIAVFDGQNFKQAIFAGQVWLDQHKAAVNALNVFPVPDGDTGKNMALTLHAATEQIAEVQDASVSVIAAKLARGALMGARGNSGVILSQILRGFSDGLGKKETFTSLDFAQALQEASRYAYRAVIAPVEGTILTVIREAAEAGRISAQRSTSITLMMEETVTAAREAVARTPDLLPTLKQAGVVDAGGQGLTYILEGILRYTRGEPVELAVRASEAAPVHKGNVEIEEEFGYEVVFLVEGSSLSQEQVRKTITEMGGVSTVVAGDETLLKVHTHTPTPGRILDYGVSLGSLRDINIENLQEQSLRYAAESKAENRAQSKPESEAEMASANRAQVSAPNGRVATGEPVLAGAANGRGAAGAVLAAPEIEVAPALGNIGTVAVASGAGWEEVFKSLNVTALVSGGQTMNPSTQELLAAVEACPVDQVILLPNNGNVIMSAQQVQHLTQKQVHVVHSDSMPAGISALLAFNFDADFETNARAMDNAVRRVDTAEITQAVRTVQMDGINVQEGDIIALVNGRLVTAGTEMRDVVRRALLRLNIAKHEIVTVYYGEGIERAEAEQLAQRIKSWFPSLEIEVVNGGQPYYAYIISAE